MTEIPSIKNAIDARLAPLKLSDDFAVKMQKQANNTGRMKKPLTVAALICLCMLISVPVMAATIPGFNALLSRITPEIAQMLQPIGLVAENNGIRMEVIAAMNDEDTAVVYLTMQDLTGNRIDKSIDLYDYSITGMSMFTSQVVAYDERTKTATIRLLANGGSELNGKKITVGVDSFLSARHEYTDVKTGIDLTAIPEDPEKMLLDMSNIPGGGGDLFETLREKSIIQVLKNDQMNRPLPGINFAQISNIGLVDGRLHVQIKWTGNGIDDHGFLYLTNTAGEVVHPTNVSFGMDAYGNTQYGDRYEENIFDIDAGQLDQFKLKGDFFTNGSYVEGKWKTTFKIAAVSQTKQADCSIDLENMKIKRVSMSPLGVTLLGNGQPEDPADKINVAVAMLDGSVRKFESAATYRDDGKIIIKYMPDSPLKVEDVRELRINGNIIKCK